MRNNVHTRLSNTNVIGGFEFYASDDSVSQGRRVQNSVFPASDMQDSIDQGKKARVFEVNGFLLGEDIIEQKRELEEILNSPGPHTWIPYDEDTEYQVSVPAYSVTKSVRALGRANIRLSLFVIDRQDLPSILTDPSSLLQGSALDSVRNYAEDFEGKYEAALTSRQKLQAALRGATRQISDINAAYASRLGILNVIESQLREFDAQIGRLLNAPGDLFTGLASLIRATMLLPRRAQRLIEAEAGGRTVNQLNSFRASRNSPASVSADLARDLQAVTFDDTVPGTPSESAMRDFHTLRRGLSALVAISASQGVTELDFESTEQVNEMLMAIDSAIDSSILEPEGGVPEGGSPINYQATAPAIASIEEMRAALSVQLIDIQSRIPFIEEIQAPVPIPASLFAYLVLGDPHRAPELDRRNRIVDHGAVGGRPLRVVP